MVELEALLELLYSAHVRSRTVSATVRRRQDQARELELLKARSVPRAATLRCFGSGEVVGEVPSAQLARLQADEQVVARGLGVLLTGLRP